MYFLSISKYWISYHYKRSIPLYPHPPFSPDELKNNFTYSFCLDIFLNITTWKSQTDMMSGDFQKMLLVVNHYLKLSNPLGRSRNYSRAIMIHSHDFLHVLLRLQFIPLMSLRMVKAGHYSCISLSLSAHIRGRCQCYVSLHCD